jgi:GNAT superfamily N-acetyltransferase
MLKEHPEKKSLFFSIPFMRCYNNSRESRNILRWRKDLNNKKLKKHYLSEPTDNVVKDEIILLESKARELDITIRSTSNEEELKEVMSWAADEGWNVGKNDAQAYYKAFPTGCKLLLKDNIPIGAIFVADFSAEFTFIGLFVVKKEYRGMGYGKELWNEAMRHIESGNGGLYAVPMQIERYMASGFNSVCKIQRWSTIAPSFSGSSSIKKSNNEENEKESILPLSKANIKSICNYDATMFPSRYSLLKAMIKMQDTFGFVIRKSNTISGYGLIRRCQTGFRIGPLYASDFGFAKELTIKLMEKIAGSQEPIIFDTPPPSQNHFIGLFADFFNLQRNTEDDTEEMFKGKAPKEIDEAIKETYAICSLELG